MAKKKKEEVTTEIAVAVELPAQVITENGEDQSLIEIIELPGYEDLNDSKVLGNVKEVFRDFDYDVTENMGKKFEDTKALAQYVEHSMEDIRTIRSRAEASELLQRGASMARFWYIGDSLDKALTQGTYGTAAYNKLATEMKKSVPYIYQLRAVAARLTVVDCYLLGIRGCDTTTLRKLAQVKDDDMRKNIIKAFVTLIKDTSDRDTIDRARKALTAAINMDQKSDFIDVSTSDPSQGGSPVEITEEYQDIMRQFTKWQKMLKKVINEEVCDEFYNALDGFFMSDTVPDAETHLDDVKAEAETTRSLLEAALTVLKDNIEHIDSLSGVAVTDADGNKINASTNAKTSR